MGVGLRKHDEVEAGVSETEEEAGATKRRKWVTLAVLRSLDEGEQHDEVFEALIQRIHNAYIKEARSGLGGSFFWCGSRASTKGTKLSSAYILYMFSPSIPSTEVSRR